MCKGLGLPSPCSGAWEVLLPFNARFHRDGWGRQVLAGQRASLYVVLDTRILPSDQRAPHLPLQNVALSQAWTEPAWGALGQRCLGPFGLFHLVQRDSETTYPTPTSVADSSPPRLSTHPVLSVKAGGGCWVSLDHTHTHTHTHTHSLCWIWPCQGEWGLALITPSYFHCLSF